MSEAKITMKLLIDVSNNKVVFAEAGKECVDFLLHILSLPLGAVIKSLTKASMIGSLYGSFESLATGYLQDGLKKDCILNPTAPAGVPSLQVPLVAAAPKTTLYTCDKATIESYTVKYGHLHVSDVVGVGCPVCYAPMSLELKYKAPPAVETKAPPPLPGYVKPMVKYMIMDDLCIEPMSTTALLNRFQVEDVRCLEEREVTVGMNEGLALLKASIKSETVLTDVFLLGNEAAAASS